jgi:hypothetical protein
MALISSYRKSKYLNKADLADGPAVVTVDSVLDEEVGEEREIKPVLYFREDVKPWIANMSGLEDIAAISGSEDTDDWAGTRLEIYVDPSIKFGGKRVGGIRVRALPKKAGSETEDPELNDAVPF